MLNHAGGTASNFLWYIKKARITAGNTVAIAGAQWRLRSGANVEIEGEDNLHQLCSKNNLHRSCHEKVFIRIVFISLVVNMNFMNCVLRIIFIGLVVYIIFISCIVRIIRFLHSHHQLHFRYLRFGKIFINYILRIFRLVIIFIIWAFSTFLDDQECVTFTCVLLYWRLNIFQEWNGKLNLRNFLSISLWNCLFRHHRLHQTERRVVSLWNLYFITMSF